MGGSGKENEKTKVVWCMVGEQGGEAGFIIDAQGEVGVFFEVESGRRRSPSGLLPERPLPRGGTPREAASQGGY